jgi:hypothetical protein
MIKLLDGNIVFVGRGIMDNIFGPASPVAELIAKILMLPIIVYLWIWGQIGWWLGKLIVAMNIPDVTQSDTRDAFVYFGSLTLCYAVWIGGGRNLWAKRPWKK